MNVCTAFVLLQNLEFLKRLELIIQEISLNRVKSSNELKETKQAKNSDSVQHFAVVYFIKWSRNVGNQIVGRIRTGS